jgi:CPA1 family monovalent cation:H+ antiporter
MSAFDIGALLLVLATAIGIINERYLHLPSVIAQLLGALAVAIILLAIARVTGHSQFATVLEKRVDDAHLPKILLDGVLALLLFAASLQTDVSSLRRNATSVFCLATVGVILSCTVFTLLFWAILQICGMPIPLSWCFVLGAILAPTDAVAVEELLRTSAIPETLKTIVVGESLFNDGTAIVLFLASLAVLTGQQGVLGNGHLIYAMIVEGGGGALLGLVTGLVASFVISIVRDDEIAIFGSFALALGTYRLASAFELSGPIAVVCCGILLSNRLAPGENLRRAKLNQCWSLVDGLLNVFLFMLLGFEILTLNFSPLALLSAAVAIPLAFIARYFSIVLPFAIFGFGLRGDRRIPILMTWLGLRGAISVALMQVVSDTGAYRDALFAACYAVVIFTIVFQGLLAPKVIRALLSEDDQRLNTAP